MKCGCTERKEIMFTSGRPGMLEYGIVVVSLITLLTVWNIK